MDPKPNKAVVWIALGRTAPRQRVLLAVASIMLAIFLGFIALSPKQAETVIYDYGYYLITFTLGWFVIHLVRVRREWPKESAENFSGKPWWLIWLQRPKLWAVLAVAGTSFLCVIAEAPREKIIYDEHVLQATAMHIHYTRNVSTLVWGYDTNGVFLPTRTYLDKRPYFFALLLSFVHDLAGYRTGNVYVLNAVLTVFTLAMLFIVARRMGNFFGGVLAVLLLGTLPLLAQNTSGSGMEILNLAMILVCVWLGALAVERPSEARLGAFVLAAVLLAQARYESVLYVFAVMLVLVAIWWREKRVLLPWAAVAAPLLLIPIPLLQRVLDSQQILWDLPKNLDSRFGVVHVGNNLRHAAAFLTNFSSERPNSPLLVALGAAGIIGLLWMRLRRPARRLFNPTHWVGVCFAFVLLVNFGLLMFYFWGELDDPVVSRLALPLYALLACCAATWLAFADTTRPATRWGIAAALLMLPVTYGRATPQHLYTSQNVLEEEICWELAWFAKQPPGPRLIMTNKSCLPWLLRHQGSLYLPAARTRVPQIAFHLREHTFTEVLVTQRLRATTPQGDLMVDVEDRLPPSFHLELLAEKRFGITLDRISRVTAIDLPVPPPSP